MTDWEYYLFMQSKSEDKSAPRRRPDPRFPAISVPKAIEAARRIFEKDRLADVPFEIAARHMGYSGLNGGSRVVLSALRKFGLVDYVGDRALRISARGKAIYLPTEPGEAARAISECLLAPKEYARVFERYPGFNLPSDSNLLAVLESKMDYSASGAKTFLKDLRESIEYVHRNGAGIGSVASSSQEEDDETAMQASSPSETPAPIAPPVTVHQASQESEGFQRLIMPGSDIYVALPRHVTVQDRDRILKWLDRIVKPAVEFAAEED